MPDSDGTYAGRVALVTGSSSGIGAATARALSAAGFTVVVNSVQSVEAGTALAAELGPESIYVQADIADRESARGLIDEVVERCGRLDVLVNNAGWTTAIRHDDLDGLTDEIFERTIRTNVTGTWTVTKAAIPHLRKGTDPSVTTITSVAGLRPIGSSVAYAMSKAALNHMTKLLAKSYGPIRFNAVAPGFVDTPWTESWTAQRAAVEAASPLGRSSVPEDQAHAVLACVTNTYMSGAILTIDGALTQVL
ncbi:SDR family NAD(P)-dependent oxidoreductase [Desertimonas flava]|uniref:SDR family NAD(P)-dependent oxidoreductase n=1 Tax=Desertimonas flava TaxID=2064846 RepID=UPI000E3461CE|nr:SDR family oxidoreductase [Desertimonas flava]